MINLHFFLLTCVLLILVASRAGISFNPPFHILPRLIEHHERKPDTQTFINRRHTRDASDDTSLIEKYDANATRLTRRWKVPPNHYGHPIPPGESGWFRDIQGRVIIYYGDNYLREHMKHLGEHLEDCPENEGFLRLSGDPDANRRRALHGRDSKQSVPRRVRDEKIPARFESQEVGQPCITVQDLLKSESSGPAPKRAWAGTVRNQNPAIPTWSYGYSKKPIFTY